MALGKADILGKVPKTVADLPREAVEAWGGTVYVRALTGNERDEFEVETGAIQAIDDNPLIGVRARLVAWSLCDEQGQRIFNSQDRKELGNTDAATLDRVFSVAGRLSGFTDKDVATLAKNSEAVRTDAGASS